jgi:hypothetical protein
MGRSGGGGGDVGQKVALLVAQTRGQCGQVGGQLAAARGGVLQGQLGDGSARILDAKGSQSLPSALEVAVDGIEGTHQHDGLAQRRDWLFGDGGWRGCGGWQGAGWRGGGRRGGLSRQPEDAGQAHPHQYTKQRAE